MPWHRLQPVLGLLFMIAVLYLFSAHRRAVRWRVVIWGLALQFLFALLVLPSGRLPAGTATPAGAQHGVLAAVNDAFTQIIKAADAGAEFVFGPAILQVGELDANNQFQATPRLVVSMGYVFAFRVLPSIIFFSALMTMAYYLGIMQRIVWVFARIMSVSMRTSGAETLSNAANIFVGQTEAPLMVRPYIARMTNSELMAIMVGGFANTAGGVLLAYIGMLQHLVPNIGAHLLISSVLTGPSSLMMAKILLPETEEPATTGDVKPDLPKLDANLLDAATRGTTEGLTLALNVAAMLVTFVALIALVDAGLAWISTGLLHRPEPWSLAAIFGKLFWPMAWLLGVPYQDCGTVGNLLGIKTFLNEFVAYKVLASPQTHLSARGYLVASYALCGFANIASIGIQIGGIGAMAPQRRGDLARLGLKAMIAGSFATFSAACVVAILMP